MSAISGMLGVGGGAGGSGFGGPSEARIDEGANLGQANQLYDQNQQALQQQQQFVQALQAQNGLGNQSNVFNQLQNVANGTGPNPAQAMLNQATGANVANQAALMAGQRGSSANPGLIVRQAAMQGANTQQQAAGQGATMQANQSLNALGAMGNVAGQQATNALSGVQGYTGAAQSEQQNILNSINQQNAARAGVQSSINQSNASMANTRMGQQANMLGNITGGLGSALGMAEGGVVPGGQYSPMDPNASNPFDQIQSTPQASAPAQASQASNAPKGPRSKMAQAMMSSSSPTDGASQAGQFIGKALGTGIKNLFGGSSDKPKPQGEYDQYAASGFSPEQMSLERSRMDAQQAGGLPMPSPIDQQYGQPNPQQQMPANNQMPMVAAAQGGQVPALVSPGEVYLDKKAVKEVEEGKDPIKAGEKIPGKAKVKGDSYANDIVPKKLETGGIVLPKSVMEHKHPHWAAMQFVSQIMAKNGKLPAKKKK